MLTILEGIIFLWAKIGKQFRRLLLLIQVSNKHAHTHPHIVLYIRINIINVCAHEKTNDNGPSCTIYDCECGLRAALFTKFYNNGLITTRQKKMY